MQDFLNQTYFHNTIQSYLIFLLILIVSLLCLLVIKHILFKRLDAWVKKTATVYDDIFLKTAKKYLFPLAYFGVFYLDIKLLTLNATITKVINVAGIGLLSILGAMLASSFFIFLFNRYEKKKNADPNSLGSKWVSGIIKAIIWTIALLLFLENTGAEINTLVASLGISSIAIAFAAQAVLVDLFGFFAILFDKPFEIGDFIVVGDLSGTVEHIGVKTTRVRSLSGEQLIFSNTDLTSSRVKNYKTMEKRRIVFTLGVTYDTTAQTLKDIPRIIKDIVTHVPGTLFDRAHFSAYADFSLNFEIVYYILSSDYAKYMDLQQEIYLKIKEEFDNQGIEFAFPTQTLYLQNPSQNSPSGS